MEHHDDCLTRADFFFPQCCFTDSSVQSPKTKPSSSTFSTHCPLLFYSQSCHFLKSFCSFDSNLSPTHQTTFPDTSRPSTNATTLSVRHSRLCRGYPRLKTRSCSPGSRCQVERALCKYTCTGPPGQFREGSGALRGEKKGAALGGTAELCGGKCTHRMTPKANRSWPNERSFDPEGKRHSLGHAVWRQGQVNRLAFQRKSLALTCEGTRQRTWAEGREAREKRGDLADETGDKWVCSGRRFSDAQELRSWKGTLNLGEARSKSYFKEYPGAGEG